MNSLEPMPTIEEMNDRLAAVPPLGHGGHENIEDGACIMEAVAYVMRRPWSDRPPCTCPVIGAFLRSWNDALPDDERDALLRPLILRVSGTKASEEVENRRALMAADWMVRTHTPAWLRLAKLDAQADTLANLPEITDMAQTPSIRGPIEAIRCAVDVARAAARDAAWADARAAAWAAARDAAGASTSDAAWVITKDAAWAAAVNAAGDAAVDLIWDAFEETRFALQHSALDLVNRMIDAGKP